MTLARLALLCILLTACTPPPARQRVAPSQLPAQIGRTLSTATVAAQEAIVHREEMLATVERVRSRRARGVE